MILNPVLRMAVLPCILLAPAYAGDVTPLPSAHAHNDYQHNRPLLDALDNGFCSVEADIFLSDGTLLVGHSRQELTAERTLQRLYLDPLRQRVRENGGRVHRDGPTFTLLIDIKNSGSATWHELNRVLAEYADIFSRVEEGVFHEAAITAVISGDRAFADIEAASPRFAGIDGRVSDIGSDRSTHLMPLISDNWRNHFRWQGDGPFPKEQRDKLHRLVRQAHQENRRIRFWASPDTPSAWQELQQARVDLINTDKLAGLRQFLESSSE